jgi:hypothetical protein
VAAALVRVRDRRYEWFYLFGAICPEHQTGAAIIMPQVNVEAMNEHLLRSLRFSALSENRHLVGASLGPQRSSAATTGRLHPNSET